MVIFGVSRPVVLISSVTVATTTAVLALIRKLMNKYGTKFFVRTVL